MRTDYVPEGVPVVRGVNLALGRFHDADFVFIGHELANKMPGSRLRPGDLVLTYRGSVGQVSMIPRRPRFPRYAVSRSQVKVRLDPDKSVPEFFAYWFRSPAGQQSIVQGISTVGVPGLARPVETIKALEVPLPPLGEQRRIASVLGALDDLIETDRALARDLSALQLATFKEAWDGQARARLAEVATVTMGQSPPGESYNETGEGTPFFQGTRDFGWRYPTAAAGIVLSARWDRDYGNIVSLRHGGRVVTRYGHLARIDRDIVPGARVGIGQRVGIEGSTGTSTGLHLHFQVEVNRTPVDPVRFMAKRGAPLDGKAIAPSRKSTSPASLGLSGDALEGGLGFPFPRPGTPRRNSLHNPPLPIPPKIKKLYLAAAAKYKLPWTLLAGIGMEETGHGRNNHTSSAGAQGLMQFMPATWATMGVDGDHDRRADIHNDADSIYSAANYLTKSGVSQGAAGVQKALFGYNPINWYVNDVLFYAARYGGGTILGDPNDCGTATSTRKVPPLTNDRVAKVLAWAKRPRRRLLPHGRHRPERLGLLQLHPGRLRTDRHPNATARLSATQLACRRKRHPDPARAGTARGPDLLGLVPGTQPDWARHDRVEPSKQNHHRCPRHRAGVGHFSYANGPRRRIFEIWRVGNLIPNRP